MTSIFGEPVTGCTSLVRDHPVLPETWRAAPRTCIRAANRSPRGRYRCHRRSVMTIGITSPPTTNKPSCPPLRSGVLGPDHPGTQGTRSSLAA